MQILVLGAGGVGESYASIISNGGKKTSWCEKLILADYDKKKAEIVAARIGDPRIVPEYVNALDQNEIVSLGKKYDVDMIITCLDLEPFNLIVMKACLELDVHYMDCGLMTCERDPNDPLKIVKLPGHDQFALSDEFEKKNLYAVCGCGVEPGLSDYFARYAEKYLFDELEEMGVRDGGNIESDKTDLAFGFSIHQTIAETSRGPIFWEKDKGFYSDVPLSHPEDFYLPHGIGSLRMVSCKHSEPANIAKHINKGLKRTSFKISFGVAFEDALKTLQTLGLTSDEEIDVNGVKVKPIDVLAAASPEMREVGESMSGKTCAGVWVKGKKDGMERQVYIYQVADQETCMERLGCPAIVAQTACVPTIVTGLIATGKIKGPYGARVSEEYEPEPVLTQLADFGFPAGIVEMESEYREHLEANAFLEPFKK